MNLKILFRLGLILLWIFAAIHGYRAGVTEQAAEKAAHVAPIARPEPKGAKPEFPRQNWQRLEKV